MHPGSFVLIYGIPIKNGARDITYASDHLVHMGGRAFAWVHKTGAVSSQYAASLAKLATYGSSRSITTCEQPNLNIADLEFLAPPPSMGMSNSTP